MVLLLVFALMTLVAVTTVLWPLALPRAKHYSGSDLIVYCDQLEEIKRDRMAGLIAESEAEAARVEVSRRLLRAAGQAKTKSRGFGDRSFANRRRTIAVAVIVLLPLLTASLYLRIGSPDVASGAMAARRAVPSEDAAIDKMIAQAEARLERNPADGRTWDAVARLYMRVGMNDKAASAWQNALRLLGDNADREEGLGESLLAAADGVITAEAKAAFDRALVLDPSAAASRFYEGLAAAQEGQREQAAKIWRDLIATAPGGASWVGGVRRALAQLDRTGDDQSGQRAEDPTQREATIRAMVDRLAQRLERDDGDVEGWIQLVRSYTVLGEHEKARLALAHAHKAVGTDAKLRRRLDEGMRELKANTR